MYDWKGDFTIFCSIEKDCRLTFRIIEYKIYLF